MLAPCHKEPPEAGFIILNFGEKQSGHAWQRYFYFATQLIQIILKLTHSLLQMRYQHELNINSVMDPNQSGKITCSETPERKSLFR